MAPTTVTKWVQKLEEEGKVKTEFTYGNTKLVKWNGKKEVITKALAEENRKEGINQELQEMEKRDKKSSLDIDFMMKYAGLGLLVACFFYFSQKGFNYRFLGLVIVGLVLLGGSFFNFQ